MKIALSLIGLLGAPALSLAYNNVPPPPQRAVPYSEATIQYVPCGLKRGVPQNSSCGRETAIEAARRGRSGPPISIPYSANGVYRSK